MRLEPWREAFRQAGVDPDFYLRERGPRGALALGSRGLRREPGLFCWQSGPGPIRGWRPRTAAGLDARTAASATTTGSSLRLEDPVVLPAAPPPSPAPEPPLPCRYRLTYAKLEEARWLGHLEMVASLYRSLRRSGLPLSFSAGLPSPAPGLLPWRPAAGGGEPGRNHGRGLGELLSPRTPWWPP